MFRNPVASIIVLTIIMSSQSQAFDLKEAIIAASLVCQKDTPLSDAQKVSRREALKTCEATSEQEACANLLAAPCLWTLGKCHLDEERFALGIKVDNVINLGRGAVVFGIASLAASVACGVAGIGLGIVCIGAGRYISSDAAATKTHFDTILQSNRRSLNRPS
jgi:hypothetical protein